MNNTVHAESYVDINMREFSVGHKMSVNYLPRLEMIDVFICIFNTVLILDGGDVYLFISICLLFIE